MQYVKVTQCTSIGKAANLYKHHVKSVTSTVLPVTLFIYGSDDNDDRDDSLTVLPDCISCIWPIAPNQTELFANSKELPLSEET